MLILSFRNSLGDVSLPKYDKWLAQNTYQSQIVIYLLWILWFINLFLMLIILLNFLIAVISQTYERVAGSQTNYTYKDRAEMNEECATILSSLYFQGEVKMIVFTYDKSIFATEDNQWGGIVDQIKKVVQGSSGKLMERINKFNQSINSQMVTVIKSQ